MIVVDNIQKKFGKLQVLNSISLQFQKGRITAIVGHNGSGKSTLMKSILGLVLVDAGQIRFDGKNVLNQHIYRENIGYMPQIGRYPDNMNIGQLIEMLQDLRKNQHHSEDRELVDKYQLESMFQKPMRTLSGGTIQKVSAALAFLFNPQVLILDEPTAGLDPSASEILKAKVLDAKSQGKTVLITTHNMSEVEELSDDILVLKDGNILFFGEKTKLKEQTSETNISKALSKFI